MPEIYTYFGFVFSFFSREHEPIHVHVEHDNRETVFDLIIVNKELVRIDKRDKGNPLSTKDERIAEAFVRKYWKGIVEKWINFFVLHGRIRCTDIKKKL
jgi:hypothetical protein